MLKTVMSTFKLAQDAADGIAGFAISKSSTKL